MENTLFTCALSLKKTSFPLLLKRKLTAPYFHSSSAIIRAPHHFSTSKPPSVRSYRICDWLAGPERPADAKLEDNFDLTFRALPQVHRAFLLFVMTSSLTLRSVDLTYISSPLINSRRPWCSYGKHLLENTVGRRS